MSGEHEAILRMIEECDSSDQGRIAEINCRVWCFINKRGFHQAGNMVFFLTPGGTNPIPRVPYCSSRDALKAIRPEGWTFSISSYGEYVSGEGPHGGSYRHDYYGCVGRCLRDRRIKGYLGQGYPKLPTEELAELHAIIQALAYERSETV